MADVPAGSRITIIGITGDSFAEPDILLSAQIDPDPGYFGEKSLAAHRQLVRVWQERITHTAPTAKRTDILGALLVAGQLFQQESDGGRKVLIIYSDMRQDTRALNMEGSTVPTKSTLIKVGEDRPDLRDVDVFACGTAAGTDASRWETLRQFWMVFFRMAGARVRSYSVLRETPVLSGP